MEYEEVKRYPRRIKVALQGRIMSQGVRRFQGFPRAFQEVSVAF